MAAKSDPGLWQLCRSIRQTRHRFGQMLPGPVVCGYFAIFADVKAISCHLWFVEPVNPWYDVDMVLMN